MLQTIKEDLIILEYYIAEHNIVEPHVIAQLIVAYQLASLVDHLEFVLTADSSDIQLLINAYKDEMQERNMKFNKTVVEK